MCVCVCGIYSFKHVWLYKTDTSNQNILSLYKSIHFWMECIFLSTSAIGLAVRVFANGPGDLGSIPGRVIPKTQKMVLDVSLLNTQHYEVRIKGNVKQSRERSSALPYNLV